MQSTKLRDIFVVKWVSISRDLWISDATEDCVIEKDCQFVARELVPILAQERVRRRLLLTRRRQSDFGG